MGSQKGQNNKYPHTHNDEYHRLSGEWRKDQAKRDYGSEVVDKASCEDGLSEICDIEPQLQHDGVHDSNGGCGKRHTRQPTRPGRPMQNVMRDGRTP